MMFQLNKLFEQCVKCRHKTNQKDSKILDLHNLNHENWKMYRKNLLNQIL